MPDYRGAFAALSDSERRAVESLADSLSLSWHEIPGLRRVVFYVAAVRGMADVDQWDSASGKLTESLWQLGCGADSRRIAGNITRALARWGCDGVDKMSERRAS